MTFGQFLSILRARWWLALLVFAITVATTAVVSFLLPKQYSASASVLVDAKPDPVSAMMNAGANSPAFMATQVDIIQSDRVSQRVVRNLKLADNPQVREQWLDATKGQGSLEVWLAEVFSKSMDVKPSRESNVITISYRAPDPRFAAGLANAFVQAYIETTLELRVDPAKQYSTFFDTRSKDARDALEKAQAKLSAFQREKSIIATDERLDIENSRLNELSSQLVMIQAITADSTSRQAQVAGGSSDRMAEVLNNGVVSSLKSDLARSEARLQEVSARYGDAHPQVVELKANIAELRSRMDQEIKRVTGGVGVSNNINRAREVAVRTELDAQRAKVLQLKAVRDEGAVLARDVESAQRSYDVMLGRLTQSNIESLTTQSNVNMLTQAIAPVQPSSPKIFLNIALSVALGVLLAFATAFGLELMDRRVRTIDDVVATLGLPLVGVLPKPNAGRRLSTRPSLMQQRVVGRLPSPAKGA